MKLIKNNKFSFLFIIKYYFICMVSISQYSNIIKWSCKSDSHREGNISIPN